MLTGTGQLDEMLAWLKDTCARLQRLYCNLLAYVTLCGLRPNEVPESLRLIRTDRQNYVIERDNIYILQNYRYKQFQRKTKRALLTILTPDVMRLAQSLEPASLNALQCGIKRFGIPGRTKWGRKIHASVLHENGVSGELVDVLQGRVPASILQRHYLRSGLPLEKIAKAVNELWQRVAPCIK